MLYQIKGLNISKDLYEKFIENYMLWYNTCRHLKKMEDKLFEKTSPKKHVKEILKLIADDGVYMYDDNTKHLMRFSINFHKIKGNSVNCGDTNKIDKSGEIVLNKDFTLFTEPFYNETFVERVDIIPLIHKRIKLRREKFFNVLVPKINVVFEFENDLLRNIMLDTKENIDNDFLKNDLLRIIDLFR